MKPIIRASVFGEAICKAIGLDPGDVREMHMTLSARNALEIRATIQPGFSPEEMVTIAQEVAKNVTFLTVVSPFSNEESNAITMKREEDAV